ncbi:MAG TPA: ComEA family DNA-binding protein [Chloroflexia bacterium]|nr:ComEA family DNA-binding protein [Chloroflexia bacterium]
MKLLSGRVSIVRFLLVAIACGVIAIGWILATGNGKSGNSVHIDVAGATTGKTGPSSQTAPAVDLARPSATPGTLSLGNGQQVDIAQDGSGNAPVVALNTPQVAPTATPLTIQVYVTGAVAQPGVYALPEGSRVQDAIAAAGGALIQADLEGINLAERLQDEAHIMISRRDDSTASSVQQPASSVSRSSSIPITGQSGPADSKGLPSTPVDINTATAEELQTLPGIGPSLAARILADRDQNGPYGSIEDLTRVTGIKEGIMAKIRAYITVGN